MAMSELLTQVLGSFGGLVATLLQGVSGLAIAAILFISPVIAIAAFILMFVLYPGMGPDALIIAGAAAVLAEILKSKFFPDKIEKQIRALRKNRPPQRPKDESRLCMPYKAPIEVKNWTTYRCEAGCIAYHEMLCDVFAPGDRYFVERTGGVLDIFTHEENLEYAHMLLVNMETLEKSVHAFRQNDRLEVEFQILHEPIAVKYHSMEEDWCFFVEPKEKKVYAVPTWACVDALKPVELGAMVSIYDFGNGIAYLPHFTYVNTRVKAAHTWGKRGEFALHSVVDTEDGREIVVPVSRIEAGDRIGYDLYTGLYKETAQGKSGNYFDKFSELWVNVIEKS